MFVYVNFSKQTTLQYLNKVIKFLKHLFVQNFVNGRIAKIVFKDLFSSVKMKSADIYIKTFRMLAKFQQFLLNES